MDKVHVEVVSKAPPGGRCEFYDRIFFSLVRFSENLYYTLIPENIYTEGITAPAVLINGKEIIPQDGILLTDKELLVALKEAGACFRKGEEEIEKWIRQEYERFTGGG